MENNSSNRPPSAASASPPSKQHIAMLIQCGQLQQARSFCQQVCDANSGDAEAWFLLGTISARMGFHDEAIEHYTKVLALQPGQPAVYFNLGCAYNQTGQPLQAIENFSQAIRLKPDFSEALDSLGVTLLKLDRQSEGIQAIREAIRTNPGNRSARSNLDQAFGRAVPRWHFPMMNDEVRNEAYNQALKKIVTEDSLVLDIGTGSGLLSMMAARAGAKHVYTFEATQVIAEKAREIIALNGYADRITVIPSMSTAARIGIEMPEKADILVSEIVDTGLLAEGVVSSTWHARNNLLKPDAPVIPAGATVYAVLVESPQIHQENHVTVANGFDVQPFNEFASIVYQQKRLNNYKHRFLCEPFEVFSFDFRGNAIQPASRNIQVDIAENGTCHAIAMWFHLHLDNEISINTWPEDNDSCWMQAVQTIDNPVELRESQHLSVRAEHDCKVIRFAIPVSA